MRRRLRTVRWPCMSGAGRNSGRSERQVFEALGALCRRPGYIHALAYLVLRDSIVFFEDRLRAEDTLKLFSDRTLVRAELMTLAGLMVQGRVETTLPPPGAVADWVTKTDALLKELHRCMDREGRSEEAETGCEGTGQVSQQRAGKSFREPIFYADESAYAFQYRDLAPLKYRADAGWICAAKGFDPALGPAVVRSVSDILREKVESVAEEFLAGTPVGSWTPLAALSFSVEAVVERVGHDADGVRSLIDAFALPSGERNCGFTEMSEFNVAYAYPILRVGDDELVLMHPYGLAEALYDSPFYWMSREPDYRDLAARNRGQFVESICFERLAKVFGREQVHRNVQVLGGRGRLLGEIDVLVLFGGRAVVVEAKSKRLTMESKKGNGVSLHADFSEGIQKAVDQGYSSAEWLLGEQVDLRLGGGRRISLREPLREVFPMTVLCDHYPGLWVQCREFLRHRRPESVARVLVTDVFNLDTVTEFLTTPLRLLNYLSVRAQRGDDDLVLLGEKTGLAWHLKYNLWPGDGDDLVMLGGDVNADLDVAMAVRREGLSGESLPPGTLTRHKGTWFEQTVSELERDGSAGAVSLGLMMLQMADATVETLNRQVASVMQRAAMDGQLHDVTVAEGSKAPGLTVHCSDDSDAVAARRLIEHCEFRKYRQRADEWFGVSVDRNGALYCVAELRSRCEPQIEHPRPR